MTSGFAKSSANSASAEWRRAGAASLGPNCLSRFSASAEVRPVNGSSTSGCRNRVLPDVHLRNIVTAGSIPSSAGCASETRRRALESGYAACCCYSWTGAKLKYPCDSVVHSATGSMAPAPNVHRGWVLAATILGSSLAFIDGTVVNVALPSIQHGLNTTVSGAQWVVESYALFLAALILLGGVAGDLYGRRLVFIIGVSLFAAASAWCGFAPDIRHLIAARALQGVGGAMLVPGSLAIISAAFPVAERGKAIGTWSGFTGITAAIGPVLGGWLVQHLSWRWVFFINLPIAAAVVVISLLFVPESCGEGGKHRLDLPGAFLITLGLGFLVFGMIEAPGLGWTNPESWGTTASRGLLRRMCRSFWRDEHRFSRVASSRTFQVGRNLAEDNLGDSVLTHRWSCWWNDLRMRSATPTARSPSMYGTARG